MSLEILKQYAKSNASMTALQQTHLSKLNLFPSKIEEYRNYSFKRLVQKTDRYAFQEETLNVSIPNSALTVKIENGNFLDLPQLEGMNLGFQNITEMKDTQDWNPFLSANLAHSQKTLCIEIESNKNIKNDIHIQHILSSNFNESMCSPKVFIKANANSEVNIIETFEGGSQTFYNHVSFLDLDKHAHVNYLNIQNFEAYQKFQHSITLNHKESAQSDVSLFAFGSGQSRIDLESNLNEEHAQTRLSGLYMGKNKQFQDIYTYINHAAPNCNSHELFKGVLNDQSEGCFTGKIVVQKYAQQTDSKQLNRNLLLSRDATANSTPQLEIYADDVKCAHGSTIGELNPEEIFYLRSRGYTLEQAKKAILEAYASEVFSNIPFDEEIKESLRLKSLDIL